MRSNAAGMEFTNGDEPGVKAEGEGQEAEAVKCLTWRKGFPNRVGSFHAVLHLLRRLVLKRR